jgi:hypothetical protein
VEWKQYVNRFAFDLIAAFEQKMYDHADTRELNVHLSAARQAYRFGVPNDPLKATRRGRGLVLI